MAEIRGLCVMSAHVTHATYAVQVFFSPRQNGLLFCNRYDINGVQCPNAAVCVVASDGGGRETCRFTSLATPYAAVIDWRNVATGRLAM